MKDEILKTDPIFFEKIWGGTRIKTEYNLIPPHEFNQNSIGEVWGVSGYVHGDNLIIDSEGLSISSWWKTLGKSGNFPYQIRVIDANDRLSIQVHPDDKISQKNPDFHRKNEAWYVLDCMDNASIVYNTKIKDQKDILKAIDSNHFEELIDYKPIRKNELIYIPAGMVHAITDKTFLIEVAECSDTTFRLYDFNRLDNFGNRRPLHIEESKQVVKHFPTVEYGKLGKKINNDWERETILNNGVFNIEIVRCFKSIVIDQINAGSGFIVTKGCFSTKNQHFKKGEFGIITVTSIEMHGDFELLLVKL